MYIIQVNTFQCVLATNEFESFVFLLYNDGGIQWTTGDGSGGFNGLGGYEAIAGISDRSYFSSYSLIIPLSLSPNILHIDKTSNVGIPGVWMFKVGTGIELHISLLDILLIQKALGLVIHMCDCSHMWLTYKNQPCIRELH